MCKKYNSLLKVRWYIYVYQSTNRPIFQRRKIKIPTLSLRFEPIVRARVWRLHATQSRHSFKPQRSSGIAAALCRGFESQRQCWDFSSLKNRAISALMYIYIVISYIKDIQCYKMVILGCIINIQVYSMNILVCISDILLHLKYILG